jgi:hypothetical protein
MAPPTHASPVMLQTTDKASGKYTSAKLIVFILFNTPVYGPDFYNIMAPVFIYKIDYLKF